MNPGNIFLFVSLHLVYVSLPMAQGSILKVLASFSFCLLVVFLVIIRPLQHSPSKNFAEADPSDRQFSLGQGFVHLYLRCSFAKS